MVSKFTEIAFVLMKRNKLTQSQVAEKYGCTREYINRILNGNVSASADVQEKILSAIDEIIKESK
jgi:transcriptional regulator with XRE-family HTH domain